MSRIIMLIPLESEIGLTAMSLSVIDFFNKSNRNNTYKSTLYISIKNSLDDTSLILKKYFSNFVDVLDNVDFSQVFFGSSEYFFLLNKIIAECFNNKCLYNLVLIEGIKNNCNINSDKINYDIAQNLSAEVIFITNLKEYVSRCFKKKEQELELFLKQKKYKNVLGIIFNVIGSPFIEKQYNFTKKLIILKKIKQQSQKTILKKKIFQSIFFSIIACIPWSNKIIETNVNELYQFLKIKNLNVLQEKIFSIEEILIFDDSCSTMSNKIYVNSLIIVAFSRMSIFIKIFNLFLKNNKIKGIILTGVSTLNKDFFHACNVFFDKNIPVSYTEENTVTILSQLEKFNFNINFKSRIYIRNLQKYISSFFCENALKLFKEKKNDNIKYSPQEFCYYLKLLSRKKNKRIILPESCEPRILKAVSICHAHNIAECVLLGDSNKIYSIANENGIKLSKSVEIIDPNLVRKQYISRLLELRKKKGMNILSAQKALENDTVLATLILDSDRVDGLVSGSINTTSDTIRPALQIIKTNLNNFLVSSIFFMLLPNQVFIYGDCAININPNAEELAEIAIQSADSSKIFGIVPRIAMLSYSTNHSGSGIQVEKIRKATSIVRERRSDLIIDGPIQYDAAVSETVCKLKSPGSPIFGSANVFIFPDLNSGNIAYKAVQRSANIVSIGPMLQGLRKPVNDLSRGASVEDIVYTIALTSIQSK